MIYLLGDVHGRFDHILPALAGDELPADEPQAAIFLGDIEPQQDFEVAIRPLLEAGIEVWWIPGNHDTDKRVYWDRLEGSMHRSIHGRVVNIQGVKLAGLGGIFRGSIWHPPSEPAFTSYEAFRRANLQGRMRLTKLELCQLQAVPGPMQDLQDLTRSGKELKHMSSIFPDVFHQLCDLEADILVTHEAPSCHPHGFPEIDVMAQQLGVTRAFHGHHHDRLDYRKFDAEFGFQAHGVGFCGVTRLDGQVVRHGEFDKQKAAARGQP